MTTQITKQAEDTWDAEVRKSSRWSNRISGPSSVPVDLNIETAAYLDETKKVANDCYERLMGSGVHDDLKNEAYWEAVERALLARARSRIKQDIGELRARLGVAERRSTDFAEIERASLLAIEDHVRALSRPRLSSARVNAERPGSGPAQIAIAFRRRVPGWLYIGAAGTAVVTLFIWSNMPDSLRDRLIVGFVLPVPPGAPAVPAATPESQESEQIDGAPIARMGTVKPEPVQRSVQAPVEEVANQVRLPAPHPFDSPPPVVPSIVTARSASGQYTTRISDADHCNSNGELIPEQERDLVVAARAIVRQDRANFYAALRTASAPDPGDTLDQLKMEPEGLPLSDKTARRTFEELLEIEADVATIIVETTPLIVVEPKGNRYAVRIQERGRELVDCR